MDLRELGTMLREERERQGLSIEDVSDRIKITRSCLAAIEDGNESVLPHPVYAKGFIKNYAKLLGVDQEDFTRNLSEVYRQDEAGPVGKVPLVKDIPDDDCGCEPVRKSSGRLPLVPILLCAVLVAAVAGLGWYLYAHVFSRSGQVADTAPPAQTAPPAPVAEPETPARPVPTVPAQKPVEAVPPAPVQPSVETTPPAPAQPATPTPAVAAVKTPATEAKAQPAPSPDDQMTQDIAVSGPAATPAPPAIPPAPEPAAAPNQPAAKTFTVGETGPHTVSITANDRCWLQAGADGGAMHETMLEKGDAFTGRFTDYLLVRLGNAGAVEIRFDNKLYPLQATKGSVKTLKFVAKKTEDSAAKPTSATPPAAAPAATPAPAPAAVASPTAAPAASSAATGASAAREVEIYGQDGSWVIITPDKGPSKEIYVKKGQRLTVPFGEKMEIKLGNPSNVVFRYDGKETTVVTEKGESKTIRFP